MKQSSQSISTGKFSSDFRTWIEVLNTAAELLLTENQKKKHIPIFKESFSGEVKKKKNSA